MDDNKRFNLLLVDDEPDILEELALFLKNKGYVCLTASNGREALNVMAETPVHLILSDIRMPVMDGFGLLEKLQQTSSKTRTIMITGQGELTAVQKAMRLGAFDFLQKPVDLKDLLRSVELAEKEILNERLTAYTKKLKEQRDASDILLSQILPEPIAAELKANGRVEPKSYESATILFTDFKDFTSISESMTPVLLLENLNRCFSYFDMLIGKYNLEKLKTIGDGYMCAGGLPVPNSSHALDACMAAMEIRMFMNTVREAKIEMGEEFWEIRIGINSGPLVAGVIGTHKFSYDTWGDTVNTAARMEKDGAPGEINLSRGTFRLVQEYFLCESRGERELKGKARQETFFLKRLRPDFAADDEGFLPNLHFKKILEDARPLIPGAVGTR